MVIAVGFRARGVRGTQFRQWATRNLSEYLVKGFVMDDERLKNPDGRPDHFDELLERIRDILASEKRFYQKVRDLFALGCDYDKTDKTTQMFFAETQNKLIYAVTGQTASELILSRAKSDVPNMGLTTWQGNFVRKGDITVFKNYLNTDEIDSLNRLVTIFLETAELRVRDRNDLTLTFWRQNVDRIIEFSDRKVLSDSGNVSRAAIEKKVAGIYAEFDHRCKAYEAQLADAEDMKELQELEEELKGKKSCGQS